MSSPPLDWKWPKRAALPSCTLDGRTNRRSRPTSTFCCSERGTFPGWCVLCCRRRSRIPQSAPASSSDKLEPFAEESLKGVLPRHKFYKNDHFYDFPLDAHASKGDIYHHHDKHCAIYARGPLL